MSDEELGILSRLRNLRFFPGGDFEACEGECGGGESRKTSFDSRDERLVLQRSDV